MIPIKVVSIVVPVFNNADFIESLFGRFEHLVDVFPDLEFEFILIDDGSKDSSLHKATLMAQVFEHRVLIIPHVRNFGSSTAIQTGLSIASGDFALIMSADLQEPDSLFISMIEKVLKNETSIVVGVRSSRDDGIISDLFSNLSWGILRLFMCRNLPRNGVDIFGCRRETIDYLNLMVEKNSSLIGKLYWLGFPIDEISYDRQVRISGKSGWTFKKKQRYFFDSLFSFTNLPIALLQITGIFGLIFTSILSSYILYRWQMNEIQVSGYVPVMLMIGFVYSVNSLGLGILGSYIWRIFENGKNRPQAVSDRIIANYAQDEKDK